MPLNIQYKYDKTKSIQENLVMQNEAMNSDIISRYLDTGKQYPFLLNKDNLPNGYGFNKNAAAAFENLVKNVDGYVMAPYDDYKTFFYYDDLCIALHPANPPFADTTDYSIQPTSYNKNGLNGRCSKVHFIIIPRGPLQGKENIVTLHGKDDITLIKYMEIVGKEITKCLLTADSYPPAAAHQKNIHIKRQSMKSSQIEEFRNFIGKKIKNKLTTEMVTKITHKIIDDYPKKQYALASLMMRKDNIIEMGGGNIEVNIEVNKEENTYLSSWTKFLPAGLDLHEEAAKDYITNLDKNLLIAFQARPDNSVGRFHMHFIFLPFLSQSGFNYIFSDTDSIESTESPESKTNKGPSMIPTSHVIDWVSNNKPIFE